VSAFFPVCATIWYAIALYVGGACMMCVWYVCVVCVCAWCKSNYRFMLLMVLFHLRLHTRAHTRTHAHTHTSKHTLRFVLLALQFGRNQVRAHMCV